MIEVQSGKKERKEHCEKNAHLVPKPLTSNRNEHIDTQVLKSLREDLDKALAVAQQLNAEKTKTASLTAQLKEANLNLEAARTDLGPAQEALKQARN